MHYLFSALLCYEKKLESSLDSCLGEDKKAKEQKEPELSSDIWQVEHLKSKRRRLPWNLMKIRRAHK